MINDVARSLWTAPRAANPPVRVWRDWALVAFLIVAFTVESLLRHDIPWFPVGLVEVAVLAYALLGRRTHPFGMLALGFATVIAFDLAALATGVVGSVSPYSMGLLLVLVYSLFRWGSGREVVLGSAIALLAAVVGFVRDHTSIGDSALGFVVLILPSVLGATVRFWTTSRVRELDQVRMREREQLARELHDTVAHHVSAMVIRAQAGRVVATTRPDAAIEALEIIEAEGSRTLAEMRTMVGALRDRDDVELAPQGGIADIERLTSTTTGQPVVDVRLSGDLEDLDPSLSAAAFRIAQESVTNALRHARNASRIDVLVAGADGVVRVSVSDDGEPVPPGRSIEGYGIVGMTERATLLGGALDAGPGPVRGWAVHAMLPRIRHAR